MCDVDSRCLRMVALEDVLQEVDYAMTVSILVVVPVYEQCTQNL